MSKKPSAAAVKKAWAIIDADREQQREKEDVAKRQFIGRCFKFRNSYGSGEDWWLYAMPTALRDGSLHGVSFQRTCRDEFEANQNRGSLMTIPQGWAEIQPEEFWHEMAAFQGAMLAALVPHE